MDLTSMSSTTWIIIVAVVIVVAIGGYLFYAWSEKKWPFGGQ